MGTRNAPRSINAAMFLPRASRTYRLARSADVSEHKHHERPNTAYTLSAHPQGFLCAVFRFRRVFRCLIDLINSTNSHKGSKTLLFTQGLAGIANILQQLLLCSIQQLHSTLLHFTPPLYFTTVPLYPYIVLYCTLPVDITVQHEWNHAPQSSTVQFLGGAMGAITHSLCAITHSFRAIEL